MSARPQDAKGHMGPVTSTVTVTPSDTNTISPPLRGILLETEGALKVTYADGTVDTFASGGLAAGVWHPMYDITLVWDTGTDTQVIHGGR